MQRFPTKMPVDVLAASESGVTNKRKLDKESNQSEIVQKKEEY